MLLGSLTSVCFTLESFFPASIHPTNDNRAAGEIPAAQKAICSECRISPFLREDMTENSLPPPNSTPFVRQYPLLHNKWGDFLTSIRLCMVEPALCFSTRSLPMALTEKDMHSEPYASSPKFCGLNTGGSMFPVPGNFQWSSDHSHRGSSADA